MALRDQVQKITDNHYVLPKQGNMKVEGHAYFSPALFQKSEEDMWRQLITAASYEGVIGAYLMPDSHSGYGVPVGSVVVTEDTLIQSCNGYDISCGILYMRVPGLTAGRLRGRYTRERLVAEIEKRISTGIGFDRPKLMPQFTEEQACEILLHGAKALGIDSSLCERECIPVPEDLDLKKIEAAYKKVVPQLGSVGGGNHFVEVQCDRDTGEVWIMVHCGSRGYGYQIADYFFDQGAKVRGLNRKYRESSYLRVDEPVGKDYWNYAGTAANFALANRQIIAQCLNEALEEVFQVQGEVYYEISHNLVQQETLVLPDGTTKSGFVHRKGATRAFPAGHPDLAGTVWEQTGHPCLIPGSMYHGAAILFAKPGAYQTACSVNHGSGRIMGRSDAKRKFDHKQQRINDEMRKVVREFNGTKVEGIVSNCKDIPLDECAHVYKDLDEVLGVLEAEGIAEVKHRLYPVANIKGTD
jgi:tRNA-splicing ligase RtcB